jgi:zinc transport system permease protein
MSYLFGSILAVPKSDLLLMAILDVIILSVVFLFYKDFLAISFDEEFARAMGVPVKPLYYVLLAMIALFVVMVIRVVGLILVIALLSIPPYMAEKCSHSMSTMMVLSSIFSAVFVILGLWLSFSFNLTSGATIIMVAALFFFLSPLIERLQKRQQTG